MVEKERILRMNLIALRQYLYNHPRLNLIQYVIRKKLPSVDACREMIDADKNPLNVKYIHYGELNKGITIYHIFFGTKAEEGIGFCCLLKNTLFHLAYADRMGFIPFIEWGKSLPYSEQDSINGEDNSFEYFMLNLSGIELSEILKSDLVVKSKLYDRFLIYDYNMHDSLYEIGEHEIEILAEMFRKYIRLNEIGIKNIMRPMQELLEKGKYLGVHVRGTDFRKRYDRHPKIVPIEKYIRQIEKIFLSHKYQYIFLATDEISTIEVFRNIFGEKVIYYDAVRSKNGEAVHYELDCDRKYHKYYLGMEILKDVYTLGHCDGLIAGISNVSIMARVIKKSTDLQYEDEIILDEGVNHNFRLYH